MKNKFVKFYITFLLFICSWQIANSQNINHPNIKCPGGVFVNSFNGNMNLKRNDLFIAGRKFNLDMAFYYNSFDAKRNFGYGNGWGFNYLMQYIKESSGIVIRYKDGFEAHFASDTINTNLFHAPIGVFDSLAQYQPGKFVLITKNKIKYFFSDSLHRRLTRCEEPNGNFLSFAYTDSLITQVTDPAGRSIQLAYSGGRLSSITDALDSPTRTVQYSYDSNNNLIQVTDPAGNKRKYSYLVNGPMNEVTDKNGNTVDVIYNSNFSVKEVISCITDQRFSYNGNPRSTYLVEVNGNGNQTTFYKFDMNGNLKQKTGNCCGYNLSFEYDDNYNIMSVTDANGNKTEYTYDRSGNLLTKRDAVGNTSRYTYESDFNKVTSYTDKNGNITTYAYDNRGNLTQVNYPMGVIRSFIYDSNGDMTGSTDGNNSTITYDYDNFGQITAIHKPLGVNINLVHDNRSHGIQITDPRGNTTSYSFDILDRLIMITDALNHVESYIYDANGNLLNITNRNNQTTTMAYDALNRRISLTDALNQNSHYSYDAKSNLITAIDRNGNTSHFTYDNLNRLIKISNALNEIKGYSYDGSGNIISISLPNGNVYNFTIDKLNRRKQVTDNIGSIFIYEYDNMNNLVGITDANGNSIVYSYDALNRRTAITDVSGNSELISYDNNFNKTSFKNFNNNIKTFTYDALNRRTLYADALGNLTNYAYDESGNLISVTDANNNTTSYIYDVLRHPTQITFADNTTNAFTWDAKGNLNNFTRNNGASIAFVYDADNRLLEKDYSTGNNDVFTYDAGGRVLSAINNDATVSLGYDVANRLITETLNGKTTFYSYNIAANKRTTTYPGGRAIVHNFDARNRLNEIDESNNQFATFNYDYANRLLSKNLINGTSTNYSYDANNRILSMITNPGGKLNSFFSYDNNGNKLFENKLHRPDQSEQYGYDDEIRLTQFKSGTMAGNSIPVPLHEDDFNYDALGNRTSVIQDTATTNYTTNNMNEYTSIIGVSSITPQYDNNGNVTNDGTFTYSYDINNHLIAVNNGAVSNYKYDAFGRRIRKTVSGQSTDFYYSGSNEIENRGNAGNVTATFIYGARIDDIISFRINNNDFFYYKNSLGSVNAVANASGNIVERYEYDPFGKVNYFDANYNPTTSSQVGNDIFFTGRTLDNEIGKYFYRARHYNQNLGRFTQHDPLLYINGYNLYSYVRNNVVNRLDPFGTDDGNGDGQCLQDQDQSIDPDQPSPASDPNHQNGGGVSDVDRIQQMFDEVIDEMNEAGNRYGDNGVSDNLGSTIDRLTNDDPTIQGCVDQTRTMINGINDREGGYNLNSDWTFTPQNGHDILPYLNPFQHNNVCGRSSNPNDPVLHLDPQNNEVDVIPGGSCNGPPGNFVDDALDILGNIIF